MNPQLPTVNRQTPTLDGQPMTTQRLLAVFSGFFMMKRQFFVHPLLCIVISLSGASGPQGNRWKEALGHGVLASGSKLGDGL